MKILYILLASTSAWCAPTLYEQAVAIASNQDLSLSQEAHQTVALIPYEDLKNYIRSEAAIAHTLAYILWTEHTTPDDRAYVQATNRTLLAAVNTQIEPLHLHRRLLLANKLIDAATNRINTPYTPEEIGCGFYCRASMILAKNQQAIQQRANKKVMAHSENLRALIQLQDQIMFGTAHILWSTSTATLSREAQDIIDNTPAMALHDLFIESDFTRKLASIELGLSIVNRMFRQ